MEDVDLDVDPVEVVDLDLDVDLIPVVVHKDRVLHTLVHSVKVIAAAAVVVSVDLVEVDLVEVEVVNGVDQVENGGLDTVVKYYLNKSC